MVHVQYSSIKRKDIYLQAAQYFDKPFDKRCVKVFGNIAGLCGLCDFCDLKKLKFDLLAEYQLFKPDPCYVYWFDYQSERILALLFCAEMCNVST